jgi:PAS domain S-box-containing protein
MTHTNKTRAQLIAEVHAFEHELQRVQHALRERDHLYRLLVENSLGLMCVHDLDGVLLAINPAAAQSLGYRPEDGIGRSLREFLAPSVRHLFDAYLTRIRQNPADSGLLRLVAKDGRERVWEYRNVRYDEPGSPPRVLGHALDITERIAAEHALRESEERFRLIAENARDMICLMDLEGRCIYASPASTAILGYPLEVLQGMCVLDLVHPDDLARVPDWRNTDAALFEFRVRRMDGSWIWLDGSSARVTWKHAPHIVGIGRDVTERKWADEERARLHEELAERECRLQDLVGRLLVAQEEERRRVAYEVHDGLAAVAASAHQHLQAFARHHRPRALRAREEFDRALELAQRTVREARRVVANLRPTTLDDFGLAAALRLQVEELRAEGWHVTYQEALGPVRLLPLVETALFRVAQEALTNARKHAHTTEVRVTLERAGAEVRLVVEDAGRGFVPEALMPGSADGERVGLPGMRERVAMLGGHCVVESHPGVGTRVSVAVPLEPPAADHNVN